MTNPGRTRGRARPLNPLQRGLLLSAGGLCVALGSLGLFLPLLPTTPFLLLAAACFARGSRRCYRWLLMNPCFGPYIRNYRAGRGITRRHKIAVLALLWLTIAYSAFKVVNLLWVRILLLLIGTAVTVHLLCLPTLAAVPPRPKRPPATSPDPRSGAASQ
ncbi:MAG: YbaN family protein [Candidatus Marinimicrobia bacterium]|nr:YbaN family protein [Candidatus Neomarinimicrobiota bacterium]